MPSSPLKIWLFLFLIVATPVGAQEATPPADAPLATPDIPAEPEIIVDELVQRTLANNPQLPIARQTQEAARQRLSATHAFRNPTLEPASCRKRWTCCRKPTSAPLNPPDAPPTNPTGVR